MSETIILGIIIAVLWIYVVWQRVPAAILFLSILVGKLFAEELSLDVYSFIKAIIPAVSGSALQIFLLVLPAMLTVLFLRKSIPKSKLVVNAVPLLFCLVTLGLFINPYFDVVGRLEESQRIILTSHQSYIVSLAGAATLFSAWLPSLKGFRHSRKHR